MAARGFVALLAALCVVSPALAAPAVNPQIKPKTGHPGTTFRVAFTAPKAAGREGVVERSYSVELSVPGAGCSQSVRTVPKAAAGERVHLRFPPPPHRA